MKNDKVYEAWIQHTTNDEFKQYYLSNEEDWFAKLAEAEKFMREKKKRPSKDVTERRIAGWLSTQLANSKEGTRKFNMKNDKVYEAWIQHTTSDEFKKFYKLSPNTLQAYEDFLKSQNKPTENIIEIVSDDESVQVLPETIPTTSPKRAISNPSSSPKSPPKRQKTFPESLPKPHASPEPSPKPPQPKTLSLSTKKRKTAEEKLSENLAKVQAMSAEEKDLALAKRMTSASSHVAGDFHPEARGEDEDKLRMNALFSELSKTSLKDPKTSYALVLDSSNFLTRDALMEVGYQKENIFIPQFEPNEFEKMKPDHPSTFHQDLHSFLREIPESQRFTSAWFDYTCTLTGNVNCRPLDDIQLFFSHKFLESRSAFALTFCKRNVQVEKEDLPHYTRAQVEEIAFSFGYALTKGLVIEYGAGMYYIQWTCVKCA